MAVDITNHERTIMKPGKYTTEFWLAAAATIFGAIQAAGLFGSDEIESKVVGVIVAGLASLGYSLSRGLAKKAN